MQKKLQLQWTCPWSFFTPSDKSEKVNLLAGSSHFCLSSRHSSPHVTADSPHTTGCKRWLPSESISFDVWPRKPLWQSGLLFHMVVAHWHQIAGGTFLQDLKVDKMNCLQCQTLSFKGHRGHGRGCYRSKAIFVVRSLHSVQPDLVLTLCLPLFIPSVMSCHFLFLTGWPDVLYLPLD